jgi:DUF1680 family protein
MTVRRVRAAAEVSDLRQRVALARGPLVYCLEGVDHRENVLSLALPADARLVARRCPELLGGVTVIDGQGYANATLPEGAGGPNRNQNQNRTGEQDPRPKLSGGASVPLVAVPLFLWDNRGPGEMTVWMRELHAGSGRAQSSD